MLIPFLVAFIIATYISIIDLFNTHPTIKWAFTKRSVWLYCYGFIFGIAGVVLCYLLNEKLLDNIIETNVKAVPPKYIYAFLSGISVKSLSTITIWNVNAGGKPFPLGISTLLLLFEPKFISEIETDNYIQINKLIDKALARHSNITLIEIHNKIHDKLASRINKPEVPTFLLNLVETKTNKEAFILYLTTFGKKFFCHTFECA